MTNLVPDDNGSMSDQSWIDEIGPWSEIKLDIVREYASAYSTILSKHPRLKHFYIDAFAGTGMHISRTKGEYVPGSPLNALNVQPPFREFFFIDLNEAKVQALEEIAGERTDVHVYHGDCNDVLLNQVFPRTCYEQYVRALCLLDPYGLHLDWRVIETAGRMKSIDLFLNFPIYDMNLNVLWKDQARVEEAQLARMDRFWGDRSWRDAAYSTAGNLFEIPEKESNEKLAEAFRKRLISAAGFREVPEPVAMRNSKGATVYYLFFASQKQVAKKILDQIFNKYRKML